MGHHTQAPPTPPTHTHAPPPPPSEASHSYKNFRRPPPGLFGSPTYDIEYKMCAQYFFPFIAFASNIQVDESEIILFVDEVPVPCLLRNDSRDNVVHTFYIL